MLIYFEWKFNAKIKFLLIQSSDKTPKLLGKILVAHHKVGKWNKQIKEKHVFLLQAEEN